VAVVDFDLESSGTTRAAEEQFGARNPHTRTVFDHIAPHSERFDNYQVSRREMLWDITPGYLQERRRGKIVLLPAAEPSCYRFGWDVTANLTPPREEQLRDLTQEMLNRIRCEHPDVRCILIDCGAGTNPIFSAAFACADYGYIITRPQVKYFETIRAIRDLHSQSYPEDNLQHISVVVNRCTSQADVDRCTGLEPRGYIPDNPTLQEDAFRGGAVDYDLGYNDVFLAVRECLAADLQEQLIPDEVRVRIYPWWMPFVEDKLAARILGSVAFHRQTLLARGLTLISAIALLGLLAAAAWQKFFLPVPARNSLDIVLIAAFVALLALVLSFGRLVQHQKKRRLLQRVDKLSAETADVQYQFLYTLLLQSDRSTLRWLKALLNMEQQQKKRNRQRSSMLTELRESASE
jgi:cellulose biosynthesis protein BcsQ